MNEIRFFAPATVANVSCGFDVLGFALDSVGDRMTIRRNTVGELRITKITGQPLPMEVLKNVSGVSALALLKAYGGEQGFDIEIEKNIKPGSGIGSSAASSAGAVFGINELLGRPFSKEELVGFAMKGEALAGGTEHADNVAPCVFGGFTLIQSCQPLRVVSLPSPDELYAVVLHPQIEVKTSDARAILKSHVLLKKAVRQSGYLGGFVAGLFMNDYDLIADSLKDEIVEPARSMLIPLFDEVKQAALENGALGCGISGSGPSIFALNRGEKIAGQVAEAMRKVYQKTQIPFDVHLSKVNPQGIKVV